MNINLHIEQLILDGIDLPPHQRAALTAAVQGELTRLIAVGGISPSLQQGGALAQVAGDRLRLSPGQSPEVMGQQIARSVYGGIRDES